MKLFIMSLDFPNNKDVEDWYDELLHKGIPSLVHLVKAFGKKWYPNLNEKLMQALIAPLQENMSKIKSLRLSNNLSLQIWKNVKKILLKKSTKIKKKIRKLLLKSHFPLKRILKA